MNSKKLDTCIVDRKPGFKYNLTRDGRKVWLCTDCYRLFKASKSAVGWAMLTRNELERVLERGKKNLSAKTDTKRKDPEMVKADKVQAQLANLKDFGKICKEKKS